MWDLSLGLLRAFFTTKQKSVEDEAKLVKKWREIIGLFQLLDVTSSEAS